jgi:hypothetical protein
MNEDKHRFVLSCSLFNFIVENLVHKHHSLDGLFLRDSDEELLKWNRTIGLVEIEQPSLRLHTNKTRNISIVWKSCRKT